MAASPTSPRGRRPPLSPHRKRQSIQALGSHLDKVRSELDGQIGQHEAEARQKLMKAFVVAEHEAQGAIEKVRLLACVGHTADHDDERACGRHRQACAAPCPFP